MSNNLIPQPATIKQVIVKSQNPFLIARLNDGGQEIFVSFKARREVIIEGGTRFGEEFVDHWFLDKMEIMLIVQKNPDSTKLDFAVAWAPKYAWDGQTADEAEAVLRQQRQVEQPAKPAAHVQQEELRRKLTPHEKHLKRLQSHAAKAPHTDRLPEPEKPPIDVNRPGGIEKLAERVKQEQAEVKPLPTLRGVPTEWAPDYNRDKEELFRAVRRGYKPRDPQPSFGKLKNLAREKREHGLHTYQDCVWEIRIKGAWVPCTSDPLAHIVYQPPKQSAESEMVDESHATAVA